MSDISALNTLLQAVLSGIKAETSGIWSYIKLPNGIVIAWGGEKDAIMTLNGSSGNCWYAIDRRVDVPQGLFLGDIRVAGAATADHYCAAMFSVGLSGLYIQMSSSYAFTSLKVTWNAFLIGRWK